MATFTSRMRNDPRLRQTWNQVASNLESANETAQAGIFTFSQRYLTPCFAGVTECVESCTKPCLGKREERERQRRRQRREGSEYMFDFYDYWDNDVAGGSRPGGSSGLLGGWGNDELDRLLAGTGAVNSQPTRQSQMNYGSRGVHGKLPTGRKRSLVPVADPATDPNVIPSSSAFGFLMKLPFSLGKKALRYQPSAADLQDNPGARKSDDEVQPLIDGTSDEDHDEDEYIPNRRRRRRQRSNTTGTMASDSGSESFRSRGDLFPSEDEDDAVPFDDEFALPHTNSAEDMEGRPKRPAGSRTVSQSHMARGTPASRRSRVSSVSIPASDVISAESIPGERTSDDLRREEEQLQKEQEEEVERKRTAAQLLARKQGLIIDPDPVLEEEEVAENPVTVETATNNNSPAQQDAAGGDVNQHS